MKNAMIKLIVGTVVIVVSLSVSAIARGEHSAAEEAQLKQIQTQVDGNQQSDQDHIQALAQQFEVPESEIERLRNNGQGWGEIKIEFAMARHIFQTQTDPETYPTRADALNRVETMRSEGKGWGTISDELEFKLGPVISEAQQEGKEIRMDMKEDAQESQEAAKDLQKESKDLMKEAQKESKQNARESREAVNDTLKEVKEIKADPKGK